MNELQQHIERVRTKVTRVECIRSLWVAATLIVGISFFGVTIEALCNCSPVGRTIIFSAILLCVSFVVLQFVIRPFLIHVKVLPGESDERIAYRIGQHFPMVRDRLLNLLQLSKHISVLAYTHSAQLVAAAIRAFLDETQSIDFATVVDYSRIRKVRNGFMIVVGGILFFVSIFSTTYKGAAYRLLHFRQEFTPPQPFYFVLTPGSVEIVRGDSVSIIVAVHSTSERYIVPPPYVTLYLRQENQEVIEERILERDSSFQYKTVLQALRTTTFYEVGWKSIRSEQCTLSVRDRPILRSLRVHLRYPSYSKLPAMLQDDFVGDITALPGTIVTLTGLASKELAGTRVLFNDSSTNAAVLNGFSFTSHFTVRTNASYTVQLLDTEGLTNADPVWYSIRVLPDEFPQVTIQEPGRNIDIADNTLLQLKIVASDDYGVTSLRIGYRVVQSRFEKPDEQYSYVSVPLTATGPEIEIQYLWNLTPLRLVPEDVVEYFAEVFDNDTINGPKGSRSNVYLLRLPSLDEVFADISNEHQARLDDLQKVQIEARTLKKEIETLDRELKKEKPLDWQTQKKVENVVQRYEELQKKIEDTKKQIDDIRRTMEQQNVLSPTTLEKYLELQQLFEQMNSEELQRLLQQLQRSFQMMEKQQVQQIVEQLVLNEEQFRQSIERTIELLKRLHIEQKLDEVLKRVSEILNEQENIGAKLHTVTDSLTASTLAHRQKQLAEQQRRLEREMEVLQQKMEEYFIEMPADSMGKVVDHVQKEHLPQQMEQVADAIQRGGLQQVDARQQHIQQTLRDIQKQLNAMRQQMLQKQSSYVITELRRVMYNVLELSKKQEELQQESEKAPYGSPRLGEIAQQQAEIQQSLQNLVQSLHELSKKSFVITPEMGRTLGEAFLRIRTALEYLHDRNGIQASKEQSRAMESMNAAAMQFHSAMQSIMKGGGSGGGLSLFQQLQHMAGQQMALNLETQHLGLGVTQEGRRLAQQQEAIRKSLDDLRREAQQSSEYQRLARELHRIDEEMKEVISHLEQGEINTETLQKQERILSRLLDASRSLRERDYEQRRRAETGKQHKRLSPPEITPDDLRMRSRLSEELIKLKEQRYAKEYQELIKKYFEALEKTEKSVH